MPEEIARHKLFRPISSGNRPPQTFSAHFLRKSAATNFFGSFPQEIGRHKTFSAHFLRKSLATKLFRPISSGNRPPQNFFGQLPEEIARKRFLPRPGKLAGYGKCLIRQANLAGVPDALCRDRGSWPGTGCIRNVTEKTSPAAAALLFFS